MIRSLEKTLRFVIPLECPVCGGMPFDGLPNNLCASCMARMPFIREPACMMCGGGFNGILDTCPQCTASPRPWERGVSVFAMEGLAKDLIHEYKYSRRPELAAFFGRMLADKLKKTLPGKIDCVMPVPLHWTRLAERGFNQALLISKIAADALDAELSSALVRVRSTSRQASLDKKGRVKNLKDAFETDDSTILEKRAILIVDDVMTTGATLEGAARAVLSAGAAHVFTATLARRI